MKMNPTKKEIDDVLSACIDAVESGDNTYWGLSYLQGVEAAIKWMLGEGDCPIDD